ncbi:alanine dehydrogenase [Antricoccus suffuscus]|uniref:Alanine dehydrogenase n=1 Tax=Antricoccus suffuscus TaxID=1629062 RepID=A0A2T0ZX48_9ACTN|nr:alanine dehydrogenase [Antricoccus suffuscus]PRZ40932.1 alanine dehydrogenase [Antricoccus suffuscus]
MKVAVPKELKNHEFRVALTPAGAHEFVVHGHEVIVQRNAGAGSSIPDEAYVAAGARIVADAAEAWAEGDLILKVKEPIASEYALLRPGQTLFTYLHLAASRECTEALIATGVDSVAYEMVEAGDGSLPLLAPMSEVAGCLAPQVGAHHLMAGDGGRGVLLGGVAGVRAANVLVLGAGVSGMHAARVASGMQARVVLMDKNIEKLRAADQHFRGAVETVISNAYEVDQAVRTADLVIGAVLVPGAKAPRLISNEQVAGMLPGSVLVDIAIDQGGCFEDSRPTSHDDPTYKVHGSLFYCVANMPGAVPHTSTYALTNATLPYALTLANQGLKKTVSDDPNFAAAVCTVGGSLVPQQIAEAHGMSHVPIARALAGAGS